MASLIKRSNGFYYLVTFQKGKRVWQSTKAKTKSGAIRFIKNNKRKAKAILKPSCPTLSEFEIQYMNYAVTNLAPSTVTLYKGAINAFRKYCGDHLLTYYTPQMIEYFKVSHLEKVSPTKVNIDIRSMKSVFSTAVNWGLLRENPFKRCRALRLPQMNPIYLTPEDFQNLLSVIHYDWFQDIVRFAVSTLMRVGEIVNLQWSSIDLNRRLINVENTELYRTKTRKSRVVPMNEWVYYFLLKKVRKSNRVFTFPDGKALRVGYVSSKFTKFVRKAPIDQKVHFHSLRHTGATWLVQNDVPIFTVQHILGHSSIATTQIYSHLGVEDMRKSVRALDLLISIPNN